jgi:hypothetical protein
MSSVQICILLQSCKALFETLYISKTLKMNIISAWIIIYLDPGCKVVNSLNMKALMIPSTSGCTGRKLLRQVSNIHI